MESEIRFHGEAYTEISYDKEVPRAEAVPPSRIEFGALIEKTKRECRKHGRNVV